MRRTERDVAARQERLADAVNDLARMMERAVRDGVDRDDDDDDDSRRDASRAGARSRRRDPAADAAAEGDGIASASRRRGRPPPRPARGGGGDRARDRDRAARRDGEGGGDGGGARGRRSSRTPAPSTSPRPDSAIDWESGDGESWDPSRDPSRSRSRVRAPPRRGAAAPRIPPQYTMRIPPPPGLLPRDRVDWEMFSDFLPRTAERISELGRRREREGIAEGRRRDGGVVLRRTESVESRRRRRTAARAPRDSADERWDDSDEEDSESESGDEVDIDAAARARRGGGGGGGDGRVVLDEARIATVVSDAVNEASERFIRGLADAENERARARAAAAPAPAPARERERERERSPRGDAREELDALLRRRPGTARPLAGALRAMREDFSEEELRAVCAMFLARATANRAARAGGGGQGAATGGGAAAAAAAAETETETPYSTPTAAPPPPPPLPLPPPAATPPAPRAAAREVVTSDDDASESASDEFDYPDIFESARKHYEATVDGGAAAAERAAERAAATATMDHGLIGEPWDDGNGAIDVTGVPRGEGDEGDDDDDDDDDEHDDDREIALTSDDDDDDGSIERFADADDFLDVANAPPAPPPPRPPPATGQAGADGDARVYARAGGKYAVTEGSDEAVALAALLSTGVGDPPRLRDVRANDGDDVEGFAAGLRGMMVGLDDLPTRARTRPPPAKTDGDDAARAEPARVEPPASPPPPLERRRSDVAAAAAAVAARVSEVKRMSPTKGTRERSVIAAAAAAAAAEEVASNGGGGGFDILGRDSDAAGTDSPSAREAEALARARAAEEENAEDPWDALATTTASATTTAASDGGSTAATRLNPAAAPFPPPPRRRPAADAPVASARSGVDERVAFAPPAADLLPGMNPRGLDAVRARFDREQSATNETLLSAAAAASADADADDAAFGPSNDVVFSSTAEAAAALSRRGFSDGMNASLMDALEKVVSSRDASGY